MHYGILGMRWGVRRYQNADGTLTAAGKQKREQREHNRQALNYRVGARRLNRRLSRMERQMNADLASVSRRRNSNVVMRSIARQETQAALDNPLRTARIGTSTILGRTVASVAGLSTSGAAFYAAGALNATMPLVAIPASAIATGVYWYRSLS